MAEEMPQGFMLHDPEARTVTVDLPAAVAAGTQVLRVGYDEQRNTVDVVVSREKPEEEIYEQA